MSYPKADTLDALKKLACDDYFDAIELSHIDDATVRAQAGQLLAQGGMHVCYGAHPTILGQKLNPNALDEDARLAAELALLDAVDKALVLSFEVTPYGDEDPDVVLAGCKRALNRAWAMA